MLKALPVPVMLFYCTIQPHFIDEYTESFYQMPAFVHKLHISLIMRWL